MFPAKLGVLLVSDRRADKDARRRAASRRKARSRHRLPQQRQPE